MSSLFLENFLNELSINNVNAIGYTESEVDDIKRLYNIEVKGQLEAFLLEMGKSDGGGIGDAMIPLYRPSWMVREHLLFQLDFFNQMQEEGYYDYLNKPFVIAWISETQYYFLQTSSARPDLVYHYDANNETVAETQWDLFQFLIYLAKENNGELQLATTGGLLNI